MVEFPCIYFKTKFYSGADVPEGEVTVRILHILANVTGLFKHYTRITNNTPFLECVVKILNEINTKQPIRFDQPKGEVGQKTL